MKDSIKHWLARAPKSSHSIRILAGAYLLYTAYCILRDRSTGGHPFLLLAAAFLFVLSGAFLLLSSLYALRFGFTADHVKAEDPSTGSGKELENRNDGE